MDLKEYLVICGGLPLLLMLRKKWKLEKRIFLVCLCVYAAGGIWSVVIALQKQQVEQIEKQKEVSNRQFEVQTDSGERVQINMEIPSVQKRREEAIRELEKQIDTLEGRILGANENLHHVEHDLDLPLQGGGVKIEWYSSDPDVISADGRIQNPKREGSQVQLMAWLRSGEEEMRFSREIIVFPRKETDLEKQILSAAKQKNENPQDTYFTLPAEVSGKKLRWFFKNENFGIWTIAGVCIVAVLLILRKKEITKKQEKSRNQDLMQAYPDFLGRLLLYLSAGFTVYNSLLRMAQEAKKEKNTQLVYLVLDECISKAGLSEREIYELFGKKCGLPCYRGVVMLFLQNLKKGGAGVVPLLELEIQKAYEERRRMLKEEGERVSLGLLLPLCILLLLVMAIVMVPAFMQLMN